MSLRLRIQLAVALALVAVIAVPGAALAAVQGQSIPGESNLGFLLAGSVITWLAFFVYVFYLSRKNNEMRRELDELRQRLSDREATDR